MAQNDRYILIQKLAQIERNDTDSLSKLFKVACIRGFPDCVRLMIEKGADSHLYDGFYLEVFIFSFSSKKERFRSVLLLGTLKS